MYHSSLLLYIDPGTGAMLFTTLIGLISAASFAMRKWGIKLRFMLSGGKTDTKSNTDKKDIVIFSDHKRYWNVFKPVCDELEARKIECCFWTASPDDPALNENYEYVHCEFIGEGNKAFARLNMMNAYICLSTTPGLDVYQWKRSKNTDYYVHTFHAISWITLYRMFGLDFYDAVLLNGEFQEETLRKIEEKRNLPEKETFVVGSAYLDTMAEKSVGYTSRANTAHENTTVLLAPSWGSSSILNRFGRELLDALKESGFRIIVRPHPQSMTSEKELIDSLQKDYPESDKWQWNFDNDNFAVLSQSDIMISDFSGVIFDYTFIFNGALLYTDIEIDTAPYDACWLDEPLLVEGILPKIGRRFSKEDIPNIKHVIEETIQSSEYAAGRAFVKESVWTNQGNAATKTADYLLNKLTQLKAAT